MKNEIEEFSVHRELLTRISNVDSDRDVRRELSESPEETQRFIHELTTLDESDWEDLLRALREDDLELSEIAKSAREVIKSFVDAAESDVPFRFSSRIQTVAAAPFLGIVDCVPYIRIIFKTSEGETSYSDQDLEDTLGIGTAVLQSVAETSQAMIQTLGIQPDRIVWGTSLKRVSRARRSIRGFSAACTTNIAGRRKIRSCPRKTVSSVQQHNLSFLQNG